VLAAIKLTLGIVLVAKNSPKLFSDGSDNFE
jgi:hypothetical protein